jgi:hypothetical protein
MKRLWRWLYLIRAAIGTIVVTGLLLWSQAGFSLPYRLGSAEYEVWAADQSNSRPNVASRGISGSWVWIWNSRDIDRQLRQGQPAQPVSCDGTNTVGRGPCNVYDIFPTTLQEHNSNGPTGKTLADSPGFGRLHGVLIDPQNRYMNLNFFAPSGGYVGIMNAQTKEAIALFRVTGSSAGRSVHMSTWNRDGSAILVANLDGKILERIDIQRDRQGKITAASFNKSASLGLGKAMQVSDEPKAYRGQNGQGRSLIGNVIGRYNPQAFNDLTPNGVCKENGCASGPNGSQGGRPNNVIICPILSDTGNAYVTFGGGGLIVANIKTTPMSIVGEYDNQVFNGAGCGGIQVGKQVWLNAGSSAGAAGATQSTFGLYQLDDSAYRSTANRPNTPTPTVVFKDPNNTATIGNTAGVTTNTTGQLPGISTRRDSHGMARTLAGSYIHTADRIQNNVEVFNTKTLQRTTYDLTSANGQGQGIGPCAQASVQDDVNLPKNDPSPDLMTTTPDGRRVLVALRGVIPVSVDHAAQGSCPGIGVIELQHKGASGKLVGVVRTTNLIDTAPVNAPGGYAYQGKEHSDPHGVEIRQKRPITVRTNHLWFKSSPIGAHSADH